jgi:Cys-tRNA(Pro)/Cys-tRNA(Cys) deacylase
MGKTNAVRLLEQADIQFGTSEYAHDERSMDAVSVARALEVEPERVFKTLVAHDERGGHYVFCIPGSLELDLKKAARAASVRRVALIPLKELRPLTGYVHGGCSPFGMKRPLSTWIDESAQLFETIYVSAGVRGKQIVIDPADVLRVLQTGAGASYADLTA